MKTRIPTMTATYFGAPAHRVSQYAPNARKTPTDRTSAMRRSTTTPSAID